MTPYEYQVLINIAPWVNKTFKKIALLSPTDEASLFPNAISFTIEEWNITEEIFDSFECIIICNVLYLIKDYELAFENLRKVSQFIISVEPTKRRRAKSSELSNYDNDCNRFTIQNLEQQHQINLKTLLKSNYLVGKEFYNGSNRFSKETISLISLIKGDLNQPIIRIDDYPTGVRPILDDLSLIHTIINEFEKRKLWYHLGIVPALLNNEMKNFLKQLKYCIPTMHGVDHCYFKYFKKLIAADDMFNKRGTVGIFNEFKWQFKHSIKKKLNHGLSILEPIFEKKINYYIPPCNQINKQTINSLKEVGVKLILSESNEVLKEKLPIINSSWYGFSDKYQKQNHENLLTFHATWEYDVLNKRDEKSLANILDNLNCLDNSKIVSNFEKLINVKLPDPSRKKRVLKYFKK